ncbi:DgyrCDS10920 [Dimorphilus gyrociliatus]|uniref:DgyrCDS10920 n=1 Tax=Dimorphilus gyrociliatus TaxID=2664684 RepID=A0A7I8W1V2_9ANNE|nr:DgyrCDS10920 [Dimorphilus gyrociliatus]
MCISSKSSVRSLAGRNKSCGENELEQYESADGFIVLRRFGEDCSKNLTSKAICGYAHLRWLGSLAGICASGSKLNDDDTAGAICRSLHSSKSSWTKKPFLRSAIGINHFRYNFRMSSRHYLELMRIPRSKTCNRKSALFVSCDDHKEYPDMHINIFDYSMQFYRPGEYFSWRYCGPTQLIYDYVIGRNPRDSYDSSMTIKQCSSSCASDDMCKAFLFVGSILPMGRGVCYRTNHHCPDILDLDSDGFRKPLPIYSYLAPGQYVYKKTARFCGDYSSRYIRYYHDAISESCLVVLPSVTYQNEGEYIWVGATRVGSGYYWENTYDKMKGRRAICYRPRFGWEQSALFKLFSREIKEKQSYLQFSDLGKSCSENSCYPPYNEIPSSKNTNEVKKSLISSSSEGITQLNSIDHLLSLKQYSSFNCSMIQFEGGNEDIFCGMLNVKWKGMWSPICLTLPTGAENIDLKTKSVVESICYSFGLSYKHFLNVVIPRKFRKFTLNLDLDIFSKDYASAAHFFQHKGIKRRSNCFKNLGIQIWCSFKDSRIIPRNLYQHLERSQFGEYNYYTFEIYKPGKLKLSDRTCKHFSLLEDLSQIRKTVQSVDECAKECTKFSDCRSFLVVFVENRIRCRIPQRSCDDDKSDRIRYIPPGVFIYIKTYRFCRRATDLAEKSYKFDKENGWCLLLEENLDYKESLKFCKTNEMNVLRQMSFSLAEELNGKNIWVAVKVINGQFFYDSNFNKKLRRVQGINLLGNRDTKDKDCFIRSSSSTTLIKRTNCTEKNTVVCYRPLFGDWSVWSEWSECSCQNDTDSNLRFRTREYNDPPPYPLFFTGSRIEKQNMACLNLNIDNTAKMNLVDSTIKDICHKKTASIYIRKQKDVITEQDCINTCLKLKNCTEAVLKDTEEGRICFTSSKPCAFDMTDSTIYRKSNGVCSPSFGDGSNNLCSLKRPTLLQNNNTGICLANIGTLNKTAAIESCKRINMQLIKISDEISQLELPRYIYDTFGELESWTSIKIFYKNLLVWDNMVWYDDHKLRKKLNSKDGNCVTVVFKKNNSYKLSRTNCHEKKQSICWRPYKGFWTTWTGWSYCGTRNKTKETLEACPDQPKETEKGSDQPKVGTGFDKPKEAEKGSDQPKVGTGSDQPKEAEKGSDQPKETEKGPDQPKVGTGFDQPKEAEKGSDQPKVGTGSDQPKETEKGSDQPKETEKGPDQPKVGDQPKETEKGSDQPKETEKGPDQPKVGDQPKETEKGSDQPKETEKGSDQPKETEKGPDLPKVGTGSDQPKETEKGPDLPKVGTGFDQPKEAEKGSDQPKVGTGSDQPKEAEKGSDQPKETEKGSDQPKVGTGSDQPKETEKGPDLPKVGTGFDQPKEAEKGSDQPKVGTGSDQPKEAEKGSDQPKLGTGSDQPKETEKGSDQPKVGTGFDQPKETEKGSDQPKVGTGFDQPKETEKGPDQPKVGDQPKETEKGSDQPKETEKGPDQPKVGTGFDQPKGTEKGPDQPKVGDQPKETEKGSDQPKETEKDHDQPKGTETDGQPKDIPNPIPAENSKIPENYLKKPTEDVEKESSSRFMAYLVTVVVLAICGYITYHNRRKVWFIIEGRKQYKGKRSESTRYHKLEANMQETLATPGPPKSAKEYVY